MLNMRIYIVIALLSFGIIGFISNTSYAILDCKDEERSIQELTKQAIIYKDQVTACKKENTTLLQEKENLSKKLEEAEQALTLMEEKAQKAQTHLQFGLLGIALAAGVGLLAGVFLTVKTKNDARQRNS